MIEQASVNCWAMVGPKMGRGRPSTDYKLIKVPSDSKINTKLELRELVLEWDPQALSPKDGSRLFDFWSAVYGLQEGRLIWKKLDVQKQPLWSIEYTKSGTFVYRLHKQKIRAGNLETRVLKLWNPDRNFNVSNYLEFHLRKTLESTGVWSTLELKQQNRGVVKLQQLLMFCSEHELAELVLGNKSYPYLQKLKARLARFEAVLEASGKLKGDTKRYKFLKD